jgi:predicted SprT family Zn-dependent metalloprotease
MNVSEKADSTIEIECKSLLKIWGINRKNFKITFEWSPRMKETLGFAFPARSLIRLNHSLASQQNVALLQEAICHELAHIVVYQLHGKTAKPHGEEWKSLIVRAGKIPRISIPRSELTV